MHVALREGDHDAGLPVELVDAEAYVTLDLKTIEPVLGIGSNNTVIAARRSPQDFGLDAARSRRSRIPRA